MNESERSRKQRAAELAMHRRRGGSEAHAARVREHMLSQDDLYSQCRFCGHRRVGTLNQVTGPCPSCGTGS